MGRGGGVKRGGGAKTCVRDGCCSCGVCFSTRDNVCVCRERRAHLSLSVILGLSFDLSLLPIPIFTCLFVCLID